MFGHKLRNLFSAALQGADGILAEYRLKVGGLEVGNCGCDLDVCAPIK